MPAHLVILHRDLAVAVVPLENPRTVIGTGPDADLCPEGPVAWSGRLVIQTFGSSHQLTPVDQHLLEGAAEHVVAALTRTAERRRLEEEARTRELRNVIQRGFILTQSSTLSLSALPDDIVRATGPLGPSPQQASSREDGDPPGIRSTFAEARNEFERTLILSRLSENGGNVSRTARDLDIPRSSLYRKLEERGLLARTRPASS